MTKGQAMLVKLLEPFGARGKIAASIGVDPTLVTRWGQGRQAPITRYRVELHRVHGIPIEAWDEPVETDSQAPAA